MSTGRTYRIEFKPSALKAFAALPKPIREKVAEKIDALAINPRPPKVEPMAGMESGYRVRSGDYRIVYQVQDDVLMVVVVKVGHRKDVYRNL